MHKEINKEELILSLLHLGILQFERQVHWQLDLTI